MDLGSETNKGLKLFYPDSPGESISWRELVVLLSCILSAHTVIENFISKLISYHLGAEETSSGSGFNISKKSKSLKVHF